MALPLPKCNDRKGEGRCFGVGASPDPPHTKGSRDCYSCIKMEGAALLSGIGIACNTQCRAAYLIRCRPGYLPIDSDTFLSALCADCPVRINAQGPHRAECGDKRSEAFYRLVFKDNTLEQVLPDVRAPLPADVPDCSRLASILGVRSTDPLMTWDGRVDSPEYHQLSERLKNWTSRAIKRANSISVTDATVNNIEQAHQ